MQKETSSNSLNQPSPKSAWAKNKVGSFWIKNKSNGRQYLSGEIVIDGKKVPCLMFKNDYQEGNTPHFHIYSVGE